MIRFYLFIFLFSGFSVFVSADKDIGGPLKVLPVQSGGRVQPFDTFARNSLRFIYGKTQFNKKSAVDILMSWVLLPEHWNETDFVQVKESVLKKVLKLNMDKSHFSPSELLNNKAFAQEIEELRVKQQNKESLDDYFKSVQNLENRLVLYQAFYRGDLPGWVPDFVKDIPVEFENSGFEDMAAQSKEPKNYGKKIPDEYSKKSWLVFSKMAKEEQELFQKIVRAYVLAVSPEGQLSGSKERQGLKKAVIDFQQKIQSKYPTYKASSSKISVELHYNKLNPFRWAWVLYLLGFLFLFLYFLFRKKTLFYISLSVLTVAFCLQGYGMALRSFIMGRPPVTNMYETVIWVPWVAVIFGAMLWWRQKIFAVFACACAVALFCLLLADSAPTLLDGRLEPLEAVLRSNFWLTTHVLIITMSYSAFFLAFAIGDVLLFMFLYPKGVLPNKIKSYARCIDRSIQVGVVLLAAGTILGGIWADYSWGRFWGWDPKETWALISLLGYLALLHGRLVGWVKEFGLAVGSVLIFFLVVMAWYGVNYVLGQGLHSYGFGSGGVEYVAGFAFFHLMYVLLVYFLRSRKKGDNNNQ